MDYKEILNNEFIKKEYNKIDSINTFPFNHGLRHVTNACKIMEKLCTILKIDEEKRNALLIATALHDVGQYDGRENHGLKAKNITIKQFADSLKSNKYYEEILSAIEDHDQRSSIEYPLFTVLVQFVDKMDFTKERLETWYRKKYEYRIWEDVNDVEFNYDDKNFGINILTNDIPDIINRFYKENFTCKIINAVKTLAKKLDRSPYILINGQKTNMNNYIILHGSFGSPEGYWFPWLKNIIKQNNIKVDVPQMPIGVGNQNYESWEHEMNRLLVDEDTIIIAHSIAPVFVCKYLIKNKIKVQKLIFVCGFNNYLGINDEYDAVNKSMYVDNLNEVKKYCNNIVCYYSDNDPYVPYDVESSFAQTISDKKIIIKEGKYINSASGYTEFEQILEEI